MQQKKEKLLWKCKQNLIEHRNTEHWTYEIQMLTLKKNEPFKEQKVNFEFDGKNMSLKSWVSVIFTTEYHPLFF